MQLQSFDLTSFDYDAFIAISDAPAVQIAIASVIGSPKSSTTFAGTVVPKYLPTVSFIFLGLVAAPELATDLAMLASCTGPFLGFAPLR